MKTGPIPRFLVLFGCTWCAHSGAGSGHQGMHDSASVAKLVFARWPFAMPCLRSVLLIERHLFVSCSPLKNACIRLRDRNRASAAAPVHVWRECCLSDLARRLDFDNSPERVWLHTKHARRLQCKRHSCTTSIHRLCLCLSAGSVLANLCSVGVWNKYTPVMQPQSSGTCKVTRLL